MGGPCPQCEHYRVGSSIARAAFAGVLPAYQPKLRQAQTLSIQQESQSLATFVQEQGAEYPDVKWLARPTSPGFNYCGLDEFDGLYYKCEVKNAEETCPDFTPRAVDAAPRPCSSCRHHRPPLGQPVRVLEETFRRYGQRSDATLNQEIRSLVQMQAEGEYQDCVDFAGFLPKLPAFLPVCMVRGSPEPTTGEPRCIVGPVVNSAARCSEWSAGTAADAESAQLDALVAHVQGIVRQAESAMYMDFPNAGGPRRIQANAEAAIVAFCMRMLNASPDHVQAVCNSFTQVFDEPWDQQLSAQIEASAPRVAEAPSQFQQIGGAQSGAGPGGPGGAPGFPGGGTDAERAEQAFARGVDALSRESDDEAETPLRVAAELGHWRGTHHLVRLYKRQGNTAEAERWLKQLAESGEASDALHLARFYREVGNSTEAERWFKVCAEHDSGLSPDLIAQAAIQVALILQERGEIAESEPWLRRAAAGGAEWASETLESVRKDSAEVLYERANDLIGRGQSEQGERLLRQAADQGFSNALYRLANQLEGRLDSEGLRRLLAEEVTENRGGEDSEDRVDFVKRKLAHVLIKRFDVGEGTRADADEGLGLLRELAGQEGSEDVQKDVQYELYKWHHKWGETEDAEFWLRKSEAPKPVDRARELIARGEFEEAEQVLREAADEGSWEALDSLTSRLRDRRDSEGLRRRLEQEVAEKEDARGAEKRVRTLKMGLAHVLISRGNAGEGTVSDVEEGLRLYLELAESGDDQSAWGNSNPGMTAGGTPKWRRSGSGRSRRSRTRASLHRTSHSSDPTGNGPA